jgi:hypothetical protein
MLMMWADTNAAGIRLGLRQGCPLSTTLFNLYIWDLHQHLTSDVQGAGVKLQGEDDQLLVTDGL